MKWDLFCKIIDEIAPYAKIIKLHWVGEPLIHPMIVDMIRYAKATTDAQLFMSTNALLLGNALAEEIRISGLDKIIFSLDGNSSKTYERIRVGGNFQKVVNTRCSKFCVNVFLA